MPASLAGGDEGEIAMMKERKKDCTESSRKSLTLRLEYLEDSPQQKFPIPLRTEDGRIDSVQAGAAETLQGCFHLFDGAKLRRFVAHNPSFPNEFPARFELRFDQNDHFP